MTSTVAIAPLDEALTFARTGDGRVIAVMTYTDGVVRGVDLSDLQTAPGDDPIDLINRLGRVALEAAIRSRPAQVEVHATALVMPVNLTDSHIAVGTNYREHAEESAVTGSPFLFPKRVQPTHSRADIAAGDGLLDYEVELCLVPLTPLAPDAAVSGGLILGNDVTDRATLMRGVDIKNPQSGRGFTDGKSAPGYLPVGDLFVVPRDLARFVAGLTLQLSVNGVERQRDRADAWIWDLDEIVRQARSRRDVTWAWREGDARLAFTPDGAIAARTLIMAGTPAGTIFQGVPRSDRLAGALRWLRSGLRGALVHHVIEAYVSRQSAAGAYLQPGDLVTICVDRMGVLSNRIVR